MNILFFLTPKSDVAYIYSDDTLNEALDKMEPHRYSAIPIINRKGEYIGTLTEGDILWAIREFYSYKLDVVGHMPITQVPRRRDNSPVTADSNIEDLISVSMNQNFVPVIDDKNSFIGIITRKDIIQYCYNLCNKTKDS